MATIPFIDTFDAQAPFPLDLRTVKQSVEQRDSIPTNSRYEGLEVYVVNDEKWYWLKGGVDNSNWAPREEGDGGGTIQSVTFNELQPTTQGENGDIWFRPVTGSTQLWFKVGGIWGMLGSWSSLQLGDTPTTAFDGARGLEAYQHSQLTSGNPHNVGKADVGLGNVDNTSDTDKPVSTATAAALSNKVDKVAGKGLSDTNFTQGEKDKLAGLESSRFKGLFPSLGALEADYPTAEAGDYADVDVVGSAPLRYLWDSTDNEWTQGGDANPLTSAQVKTLYEANPDTNAFTNDDKNKLDTIQEGAEANVNPDWNASSGDGQILNKPTTIGGYGITNAYTKSEVDARVVHKTGDETIEDVKTFTSIPVLPNTDPTADNQAARKKYVDDGLADKVEVSGDLAGTPDDVLIEKIRNAALEGQTTLVAVLPDGTLQAQETMEYEAYDETVSGYATLAAISAAYSSSMNYQKGFQVICPFMTPPTIYKKVGQSDSFWLKMTGGSNYELMV